MLPTDAMETNLDRTATTPRLWTDEELAGHLGGIPGAPAPLVRELLRRLQRNRPRSAPPSQISMPPLVGCTRPAIM